MIRVYHLLSDYSREPAVMVSTLREAKTWCRRDSATMFWPQGGGDIVAANKQREAIHVIVGFGGAS
jgi:hypothetical protein